MKLTEKDRDFLERLRELMRSHDLSVELKVDRPSYMVLRGTYGDKINRRIIENDSVHPAGPSLVPHWVPLSDCFSELLVFSSAPLSEP